MPISTRSGADIPEGAPCNGDEAVACPQACKVMASNARKTAMKMRNSWRLFHDVIMLLIPGKKNPVKGTTGCSFSPKAGTSESGAPDRIVTCDPCLRNTTDQCKTVHETRVF